LSRATFNFMARGISYYAQFPDPNTAVAPLDCSCNGLDFEPGLQSPADEIHFAAPQRQTEESEMNILKLKSALIAALLASTLPLAAADSTSTHQYNKNNNTGTSSSGAQASKTSERMSKDCSVNKILHADVKSKDGQALGGVEDILLNPNTGKIDFVVLGQGGVLGIGEDRIPVPWKAVSTESDGTLLINKDKAQLKSAPSLKKDYSNLEQPDYTVTVYEFYEVPVNAGGSESPGGVNSGGTQSSTNTTHKSSHSSP
jgi:sporulation protein YlmC with PRC-barrel domain